MAGTDMNAVVSLMQDTIQTQQNSLMQGLASTAASSGKTGADFEEYMKASVSTTEESKSSRSIEKNITSETEEVKKAEVTEATKSEQPMVEKTVKNQSQEVEGNTDLSGETKERVSEETLKVLLPQKIQGLLEITENSTEVAENMPEDLLGALAEIETELMQKIMESFDVTEEELKEAMEVLAISMVDLLQTDKLKELAVYVSGEESLVSLVTNADMYNAYKEVAVGIEEISATLMDKFSVTPEELQQIVSQLKETTIETTQNIMESVNMDVVSEEASLLEGAEQPEELGTEEKQPQILVEVSKTVGTSEKQNADSNVFVQENGEIQTEITSQDAGTQQQGNFASTENGEETEPTQKSNENSAIQTNTSYSTVVTETEVQTVVKTQQADFDGIVRQIVEQIKVQIKPDVTSMELQLNPENLGKVNLQVTSKEGAVTAQLFVQNETVKAMIESQLMVLREAMNEQGVKVEAVEVTVETGQFGRSLEQHSEQQKQEAEKQAKSYQHRAINLLAGIEEESMDAEELLRAHIMRESGNSVDMNA